MFGIFDDLYDAAVGSVNYVTRRVNRVIEDPVGETVRTVTQPVVDAVDVIDGLSEGELRTKAAIRLGADVASGMLLSELIKWYDTSGG